MKHNMNGWKNSILKSQKRQAMPILTHTGIEFNGKHVKDAVTCGQVHFEAINTLCGIYPSAAITTIMDLTVEAEAFGADIVFFEHEVPCITGRLVHDRKSIEQLPVPSIYSGRIREYLLAGELVARHSDRPIFCRVYWSLLACRTLVRHVRNYDDYVY